MTKKLFALRDTRTNKLVPELFFSDKPKAKAARAHMNPKDEEGAEILHFVVTYGPDHRHFGHAEK